MTDECSLCGCTQAGKHEARLALEQDTVTHLRAQIASLTGALRNESARRDAALARVGVLERAATLALSLIDYISEKHYAFPPTLPQIRENLRSALAPPPPHDGEGK